MIYVTENGVSEKIVCTDLCDEWRIQYFRDYINEMLKGQCETRRYKFYTCLIPALLIELTILMFLSPQRLTMG